MYVMPNTPTVGRRKLDARARKCVFVGYSRGTAGYRLIDVEDMKLTIRRDVTFDESRLGFDSGSVHEQVSQEIAHFDQSAKGKANEHPDDTRVAPQEVEIVPPVPEIPAPEVTEVRPTRVRKPISRYGIEKVSTAEHLYDHYVYHSNEMSDPVTLDEALSTPEGKQWENAAYDEYRTLLDHDTWELTDLPEGRKAIGSKWVFKRKLNDKGEVARYKCCLVAQGFAQKEGIDFTETFAPVAKFGAIRTLLAHGTQRGMHIHQMDVKTAFLHGHLEETIYMKQPEGFEVPGKEHMVCKLKRSLYGLKQSSRCWFVELKKYLVSLGYEQSKADPCVFLRWENGNLSVNTIYVDDIILLADIMDDMVKFKGELSHKFEMTDLGPMNFCLGISVITSENTLKIHQRQYIQSILNKFEMSDAHPVCVPADPNVKLNVPDGESRPADRNMYQQIIGSLQYVANGTRPDIAFIVNALSRYNSAPTELHMTALKRVLRYLKGTQDLALTYSRETTPALVAFSDADWAGDTETRKSTSGNVFLMCCASCDMDNTVTEVVERGIIVLEHCPSKELPRDSYQYLRGKLGLDKI